MFNPMTGRKEPAFWQQILLVAVPAFVGACLPPIISHHLETKRARNAAHHPKGEANMSPKAGNAPKKRSSPKEKAQ